MNESILGADVPSLPMSFAVVGESFVRLMTLTPNGKIILGENLGVFDLSASPPTFTGDVDASARAFIDAVLALSAARQSDSRSAPEPAENRFDSDATDQLSSEERMHRFDEALRADYSLQDALDFNLASKASGGEA